MRASGVEKRRGGGAPGPAAALNKDFPPPLGSGNSLPVLRTGPMTISHFLVSRHASARAGDDPCRERLWRQDPRCSRFFVSNGLRRGAWQHAGSARGVLWASTCSTNTTAQLFLRDPLAGCGKRALDTRKPGQIATARTENQQLAAVIGAIPDSGTGFSANC